MNRKTLIRCILLEMKSQTLRNRYIRMDVLVNFLKRLFSDDFHVEVYILLIDYVTSIRSLTVFY